MEDPKDALKDYLRGIKSRNRIALAQLLAITDWHGMAQRELERRASLVVQMFNDEVMVAIANGELNVKQAIAEVLTG